MFPFPKFNVQRSNLSHNDGTSVRRGRPCVPHCGVERSELVGAQSCSQYGVDDDATGEAEMDMCNKAMNELANDVEGVHGFEGVHGRDGVNIWAKQCESGRRGRPCVPHCGAQSCSQYGVDDDATRQRWTSATKL